MATTLTHLPQKSLDWLQSLIEVNIDSRDGFREAADNLKETNPTLEAEFRQLAMQRDRQASELQDMVEHNAEKPKQSGSFTAAAHRTWMDLRTAMGGGEHAVLSEAERGEDYIKGKYESALEELASCRCAGILRTHHAAVKASHDKVRDLRDRQAT